MVFTSSRAGSSKCKNGLRQCAKSWASRTEGPHGWIRWSWLSLSTKNRHTEAGAEAGYKDIGCAWRDGVRKAKAQLELKWARRVEDNRKGFLRKYIGSKRKAKENVGPLLSGLGNLVARQRCTSLPFLPQFSLVPRPYRSPSLLAESTGVRPYSQETSNGVRAHLTTWMCARPWNQLGCIQGCRRSWLMSLWGQAT